MLKKKTHAHTLNLALVNIMLRLVYTSLIARTYYNLLTSTPGRVPVNILPPPSFKATVLLVPCDSSSRTGQESERVMTNFYDRAMSLFGDPT